jgi:hypothetical protein
VRDVGADPPEGRRDVDDDGAPPAVAPGRVGALEEEVERSLRFFEPDAGAHRVVLTPTT